jgi:GMP synthase-like glutamine amidotransferase
MRVHWFQHVPFEGLGAIGDRMRERGARLVRNRRFEGDDLPPVGDVDFLVVLGGPMSVNDEADYPWLRPEKDWIRRYLETGRPALGICLGAQLVAAATDASVGPAPRKEIGWFPVKGRAVESSGFAFPEEFTAFHWHGENFELPAGAEPLAHTESCPCQAFRWGERVIGTQFHLETTAEAAEALVRNCPEDLADPGETVQGAARIRKASSGDYEALHGQLDRVLSFLLRP